MAGRYSFADETATAAPSGGGRYQFADSGMDSAPQTTQGDAFLYNAADSFSLGFGDEIAGAAEGIGASLQGDDYMDAYRKRVDSARERLAAARAQHPLSSMAGSVVGALPLAAVTGGAGATSLAARAPLIGGLARAAAGRGAGALGAQAGLGALGGAAGGAAYGFGSGTGNVLEGDMSRFASAGESAKWGAGLGLASPIIGQGLSRTTPLGPLPGWAVRAPAGAVAGFGVVAMTGNDPLAGAGIGAAGGVAAPAVRNIASRAWDALPGRQMARSGQTNAFIGLPIVPERPSAPGMGIGGGGAANAAAPPPSIPGNVVRDVDRVLGREQYGVDELQGRLDSASAQPLGRTLADVGGEQFLAKADLLAQSPGTSGPVAARIAEERAGAFAPQINAALREKLGVDMSPTQSLARLREAAETASDGYEQVLAQAPNAQIVAQKIAPLMKTSRHMQSALASRFEIEETQAALAALDGVQPPPRSVRMGEDGKYELLPNATGRALHSLKTNIDDVLEASKDPRSLSSAGKGERMEALDPLRNRYLAAMDEAIPGYKQVRAQRGDLFQAEKALDEGRQLLTKSADEIRQIMDEATPFQRKQYQIAAADDIRARVMKAGADEDSSRLRNAANPIINPEMKSRIRAIFDDADKADEFIRMVNQRDRLFRNSARWVGGADTYRRAAQAADQGLAQMADMGAQAATGNPGGAAMRALETGYSALRGRHLEKRNNELGNALLKIIDDDAPENRAYIKQLLDELRKLERERMGRAQRAGGEGLTGAIGGGAVADEGY